MSSLTLVLSYLPWLFTTMTIVIAQNPKEPFYKKESLFLRMFSRAILVLDLKKHSSCSTCFLSTSHVSVKPDHIIATFNSFVTWQWNTSHYTKPTASYSLISRMHTRLRRIWACSKRSNNPALPQAVFFLFMSEWKKCCLYPITEMDLMSNLCMWMLN